MVDFVYEILRSQGATNLKTYGIFTCIMPKQALGNASVAGDLFHITFQYLLEMKSPQCLGDMKN